MYSRLMMKAAELLINEMANGKTYKRKKEVVHKTTVIDDKRLQSTVKRIAYTSPNQKLTLVAANDVSLKSEPTKDTHRKPQVDEKKVTKKPICCHLDIVH
ncbi:hypothetical protein Tco_0508973 [Tanacetum coccineum]